MSRIRRRFAQIGLAACRIRPAAAKAWLKKHPRVQVYFPPGWSFLVEVWFGILTRKLVLRGSFDSICPLTRHTRNCISHWNRNPHPPRGSVARRSSVWLDSSFSP